MDHIGIYQPGVRDHRCGASDSAHSAFLHADIILFCKKLRKAAQLVYGHRIIQEASGKLCEKQIYDTAK